MRARDALLSPEEVDMRLPLMMFTSSDPRFSCIVSWSDEVGLVCDCATGDACAHLLYVEALRSGQDGVINVSVSDSGDVGRSEIEAMVADGTLQDWLMKRLPVVDIDNRDWLQRVEKSWLKPN